MTTPDRLSSENVSRLRSASRRMVRELGFMDATLAASDYPPSAVHALLEVEAHGKLSSVELTALLLLDQSTVSRLVRKLGVAGELTEQTSECDRRIKALTLTPKGKKTVTAINRFATGQVRAALATLPPAAQESVLDGILTYSPALAAARLGSPAINTTAINSADRQVTVDTELRPGDLGRLVALQATTYASLAGFELAFETKIASEFAEFVARRDPNSQTWVARNARDDLVGSITIDRAHSRTDAHLRWFIVAPEASGLGIGRTLLHQALDFSDSNHVENVYLWTFQGLDAARHLYDSEGFTLTEESKGAQWGTTVLEQRLIRHASP